jgi:hypothetical protein
MLGAVSAKFNQFKAVVKASFENVRADIDEVKRSVTDWILYLDSNQRDLKVRIAELEREVAELKRKREVIEVYN